MSNSFGTSNTLAGAVLINNSLPGTADYGLGQALVSNSLFTEPSVRADEMVASSHIGNAPFATRTVLKPRKC